MPRDYFKKRDMHDSNDQDQDSGYSKHLNEYRELYNPYKSTWSNALKRYPKVHSSSSRVHYSQPERDSTNHTGMFSHRVQTQRLSGYHQLSSGHNEEDTFESGFNVKGSNTYNTRTTGYGPRD